LATGQFAARLLHTGGEGEGEREGEEGERDGSIGTILSLRVTGCKQIRVVETAEEQT